MRQPDLSPPEKIFSEINTGAMRARIASLARLFGAAVPVVGAATSSAEGLKSWVDAWTSLALAARLTDNEIKVGLSSLEKAPENVPFGWSVFVRLCRPTVNEGDAHQQLVLATNAWHAREFSSLDPATWQATQAVGYDRLFWGRVQNDEWAEALEEARRIPDPAVLNIQPCAQHARVTATPEARSEVRLARRASAANDRDLAFAAIGLKPPLRPPPD